MSPQVTRRYLCSLGYEAASTSLLCVVEHSLGCPDIGVFPAPILESIWGS